MAGHWSHGLDYIGDAAALVLDGTQPHLDHKGAEAAGIADLFIEQKAVSRFGTCPNSDIPSFRTLRGKGLRAND